VSLEGEPFDLEDARELFADLADIRISTINVSIDRDPTVLMAEAFEQLDDTVKVIEASKLLIDLINGILFVREPNRKPLRPGTVHERRAGTWHPGVIYARVEVMEGRDRLRASAVVLPAPGSPPPPRPPPPPHTIWLKYATTDSVISDVLTFLRGGARLV
jgi:hypothetical protein